MPQRRKATVQKWEIGMCLLFLVQVLTVLEWHDVTTRNNQLNINN